MKGIQEEQPGTLQADPGQDIVIDVADHDVHRYSLKSLKKMKCLQVKRKTSKRILMEKRKRKNQTFYRMFLMTGCSA